MSISIPIKLGLGAIAISLCWSCSAPQASLEETPSTSLHYAKDGTRFQTALHTTAALPYHFPEYLILPEATILSSGQIEDRMGGVASLLLQTDRTQTELLDHYREGMWFRYWDLLSEVTPEETHQLTFEYVHPEATRYQQAVIQISTPSTQPDLYEVLILFSYDTPTETWANYPQKSSDPIADQAAEIPALARSNTLPSP